MISDTIENPVAAMPADEEKEGVSRKLDEKLMELQSLFEVSQTLNSSLNIKSILDIKSALNTDPSLADGKNDDHPWHCFFI